MFRAQNVTQEKTKFGHVVRVLPARYASEVRDIILRPPEQPYKVLKAELTKRVCPSKRQRLQQLLHVEDLGDRKPSQILRYMLKLRGDAVLDANRDEIFRELFLQKLPITIRTPVATHKDAALNQLTEMADDMAEVQGPQQHVYQVQKENGPGITAIQSELLKISKMLQSQSRSTHEQRRSPSQSGICWYHEHFGSKAKKCREPRADRFYKSEVTLRAANNSTINTYGFRQLTLDFGLPRPLTWKFVVADLYQPIVGADFLLRHKLLVDLEQRRLLDTRNGRRVELFTKPHFTHQFCRCVTVHR